MGKRLPAEHGTHEGKEDIRGKGGTDKGSADDQKPQYGGDLTPYSRR